MMMLPKTETEYFALDRKHWAEVEDKYVLNSGYVYLGKRHIGHEIRIYVESTKF
jgi:hypothetical protein